MKNNTSNKIIPTEKFEVMLPQKPDLKKSDALLVLDTNMLIYLCEPKYYDSWVFDTIFTNKRLNLVLAIPEVSVREWDLLLHKRYISFKDRILDPLESALLIQSYFRTSEEKIIFEDSINKLIKYRKREYQYTTGRKFRIIDELINYAGIIRPSVTETSKCLIADMALNKEEPFFCDTNPKAVKREKFEIDDAYIFFSTVELAKEVRESFPDLKIYFVSNNTKEFSKYSDSSQLHENLEPFFQKYNITFSNNLESVLSKLDPDNPREIRDEMEEVSVILHDDQFVTCEKCNGEVHIKLDGKWAFGQWYLTCYDCLNSWKFPYPCI
ncbi:hypothetical protein [Paenibacillus chitinolyticus]|uniref:hypothetical protein n=1 Tax=Paenibacillus chitinolyticus TaxID=79263 RepID=UPI00366C5BBA